jgi:hypothetical protein
MKRKPKHEELSSTVMIDINLPLEDILSSLIAFIDHRNLLKFIIRLDEGVQDWDFTIKLYKHFKAEAKKFKKECED